MLYAIPGAGAFKCQFEGHGIQRAMDRSRRATNLDNFDAKGRAIKGKRRWNRSQRYQALAASKRERDLRYEFARHSPSQDRLGQCGTAPEDGDVECTSTCKREGLCPTPRP